MRRLSCLAVIFLSAVSSCICVEFLHVPRYPFDLDSAGQAIEGFVYSKLGKGERVRITDQHEGKQFVEGGIEVAFLKVVVRTGVLNGTEEYIVVDTDAFKVDKDGYIIVNSTETFDHWKAIEFYVVLFRGGDIVSNPVPFIVRVENRSKYQTLQDEENYPYKPTAAVFAGVLICFIVAFALIIPFVVRAKRWSKHGKPIFNLGSQPSALNKAMSQEKGGQANLTALMVNGQAGHREEFVRTMTEGDFYDNRGFRLEEGVERERDELPRDLMAIAHHVEELDEATNVIQIRKKHNSDSDSGMSSDKKKEKGKGILKRSHKQEIYSVEMEQAESSIKKKPTVKEETSHL